MTRQPGMTATERQRKFKARQAADGLTQICVWVPRGTEAGFQEAAETMRIYRGLSLARLVDETTGRLCGLEGPRWGKRS